MRLYEYHEHELTDFLSTHGPLPRGQVTSKSSFRLFFSETIYLRIHMKDLNTNTKLYLFFVYLLGGLFLAWNLFNWQPLNLLILARRDFAPG